MTDLPPEVEEVVQAHYARQAATRDRYQTIANSAEAVGRENLAFALALRLDIPADRALSLLTVSPPDLREVRDIFAWVNAIPRQPEEETVQ